MKVLDALSSESPATGLLLLLGPASEQRPSARHCCTSPRPHLQSFVALWVGEPLFQSRKIFKLAMQRHRPIPSYTKEQVERAKKFWCWDCGEPSPLYMVNNDIWKAAWPEGEPNRRRLTSLATTFFPEAQRRDKLTGRVVISICLCFTCLEHRINRKLTLDDFQRSAKSGRIVYANTPIWLGYRMGFLAAKKAEKVGDKKDEGG